MGRKAKAREQAKGTTDLERAPEVKTPAPGAPARQAEAAVLPLTGGVLDTALVAGACITLALVGWWFKLDVNRVFDVPKALALKVGGGGIFLVWLLYGSFGRGYPWRSMKLFAAPVFALLGVLAFSTLLSIDPWMSLYGVYERQFGFQGLLACVGLFVVTATCLRTTRGAVLGLTVLLAVAGVIGAYAYVQSQGLDPYGFKQPLNKVYATLGNATFAGNALALVFPVSLTLAGVATARVLPFGANREAVGLAGPLLWLMGLGGAIALLVGPAAAVAGSQAMALGEKQLLFKAGIAVLLLGLAAFGATGSFGPESTRGETERGRRMADALAAGVISGLVLAIGAGLIATRTRGAWVGTGVAIVAGLLLLPAIFRDAPERQRWARIVCWGSLALVLAGFVTFMVVQPEHLYARTIRSIPHAFDPDHKVYGQGQGTRRYLWTESPRVLFNHEQTLERLDQDRVDRLKNSGKTEVTAEEPSLFRRGAVLLFGIGIETYRYAFMSHKSKELEALDPMTNHDNPHNNYLYILASCGFLGLAAYLWLLWRLLITSWRHFRSDEHTPAQRALAFGVVTSFFSYSVYSIAGFDSVASSVFLYFLLGSAAVLFAPSNDEPRRPVLLQARRHWAEWRKLSLPTEPSTPAAIGVAVIAGAILAHTVVAALQVHEAEQVFVSRGSGRNTLDDRVASIKKAIEINPRESFYWQTLGSTYADAARQYREGAARAQQQGKSDDAQVYSSRAREYFKLAEEALHRALDHAWAPENIFISMFQLYYGWQQTAEAERALSRALEHSPHLGPVRANLAVLKLENRQAYDEALADCLWVLEVEPGNATALRTCGRAYQKLGDLEKARSYLTRAKARAPKDPVVQRYLDELDKAEQAKNATTAAAG